jgi:F0F1-type ATP synthase membrane subunit b/b'
MLGPLLAFLGFIFCVYGPLRRSLLGGLRERQSAIKGHLKEVEDVFQESQKLWSQAQHAHATLQKQVDEIIKLAQKEADFFHEQAQEQMKNLTSTYEKVLLREKNHLESAWKSQIKNQLVSSLMDCFLREGILDDVEKNYSHERYHGGKILGFTKKFQTLLQENPPN